MKSPSSACARKDANDELIQFQTWLRGLSHSKLLRSMEFAFVKDQDSGSSRSTTNSHEWELLQDMVRLQAPPPTPIHARALGFLRPATDAGPFDGRNEPKQRRRQRQQQPRLFQLVERTSAGCAAAVSTRSKRNNITRQRRFEVVAKKFVTPWGEVLSVGCTREQELADAALFNGTRIHIMDVRNKEDSSTTMMRCSFDDSSFCCTTSSPSNKQKKKQNKSSKSLLRMLHVASRGRFLSLSHVPEETKYVAPWFHPEGDWFSLPMYLASRFEVALWNAFRSRCTNHNDSWALDDAARSLSEDAMQTAMCVAVAKTLLLDVLMPTDVPRVKLRDTELWKLLCDHEDSSSCSVSLFTAEADSGGPNNTTRERFQKVALIPLTELGSSSARFRRSFVLRLRDAVALELQKSLLDSLNHDSAVGRPVAGSNSKSKRKKRKRKKSKASTIHRDSSASVAGGDEDENEATKGDSQVEAKSDVQLLTSPNDLSDSVEKTKTYVAVWRILNDVVDDVFERVGLNEEQAPCGDDKGEPNCCGSEEVMGPENSLNPKPAGSPSTSSKDLRRNQKQVLSHHARVHSLNSPNNFLTLLDPSTEINPLDADVFDVSASLEAPSSFDYSIERWKYARHRQTRERSIFADLFITHDKAEAAIASSTAASIASSSDKELVSEMMGTDVDQIEMNDDVVNVVSSVSAQDNTIIAAPTLCEVANTPSTSAANIETNNLEPINAPFVDTKPPKFPEDQGITLKEESDHTLEVVPDICRSPSPPAPLTPPPQLSPILVNLADLRSLRSQAMSENEETPRGGSLSNLVHGSVPSSPIMPSSKTLTPSWSREDLRMSCLSDRPTKEAKRIRPSGDEAILSYRAVAAKSVVSAGISSGTHLHPKNPKSETEICARSETAIDTHTQAQEASDSHFSRSRHDDVHVEVPVKDGSSTIGSTQSPNEELVSLREERNSFRDMCLTLGAEVSKLKNLLAAHSGSSVPSFVPVQGHLKTPPTNALFDPDFMPRFFPGIPQSSSIAAMSDAGLARGDHDSAISEDGTDVPRGQEHGRPRAVHVRKMSSGITAGSDASVEQSNSSHVLAGAIEFNPLIRPVSDSIPVYGIQSRLTQEITKFLRATNTQLRKQDSRKAAAIERLTRLVTAVWPRAQVKIYGSHITGFCLPSSDLDFVICLPAVHKKAPADAPGDLEGRNAINETPQKILARKLKSESWIDPRSIKLIERTVVPVVKVFTKDTKARMLQLDISFDAPEHHGLAAIELVTQITQELPMIQPLVLILKQFLLDRGLLTAYTGGLSSHCLFLMVARFLQEQPSTWDDCGSLLMGFLDFYGNSFDPRATGISVARRQYFSRPNYTRQHVAGPQMWPLGLQSHLPSSPSASSGGARPDFLRRHSFNEKGTNDGLRTCAASVHGTSSAYSSMRPPRFQSSNASAQPRIIPEYEPPGVPVALGHAARPYTFDPLFVEDPLSAANNVGRNAFRIFQIQRAFSDAHRALVASLEWDLHSDHDDVAEYPLLNCLLQSEDMFYELEETNR